MADDGKLIERLAFDIKAARRDHIAAGEGTAHWPMPAARAVLRTLADAGRLLPSGGEVSTQWSVVFKDGFRAKTFQRSMASAYRAWLDDPSIATVGSVEERTVTTWSDGTQLLGPWSPVVSDNSEASGG